MRSALARTSYYYGFFGVPMQVIRASWCCLVAAVVLGIAAFVSADKVTLKDGTVLEGTALKEPNGYWFKGVDGQRRHLTDDEVASVEKGPVTSSSGGATPHHYAGSLASTKARAEDCDTPVAGVAIWQEYIDSKPTGDDLKVAQEELAKWKKLQSDNAEKIKGRWVGGQEREDIIQKYRQLETEGVRLIRQHQTIEALKKLQEAQRVYPNSFTACFWLGYLAMLQDNDSQAVNYFNQALRLHPNSPEALANLGVVQWHKRQFQDAIMTIYKAAQNGDNKEIAQDLVNAIAVLPPYLQRTTKLQPVIEASRLLAVKYGIGGPVQTMW
ncbi:MAG TPA: tetratricopeptide repeat protein, partial [Tepidisphaeraceae bacterium]|nr:tetratricopeptide repeat protein [Tepidisphaeraceae bacterium]